MNDMKMCRGVVVGKLELVRTQRGDRRTQGQVCEDMQRRKRQPGLAQSQKPIHPVREQSQSAPVGI